MRIVIPRWAPTLLGLLSIVQISCLNRGMNTPEREPVSRRMELDDAQIRLIAELRSAKRNEVIACAFCDVDSPESLEAALVAGWTRLQIDDGFSWNYLGICRDCEQTLNIE